MTLLDSTGRAMAICVGAICAARCRGAACAPEDARASATTETTASDIRVILRSFLSLGPVAGPAKESCDPAVHHDGTPGAVPGASPSTAHGRYRRTRTCGPRRPESGRFSGPLLRYCDPQYALSAPVASAAAAIVCGRV